MRAIDAVVGGTCHAPIRTRSAFFPRPQIVPIPHNTVFEQFTPLFGVSYSF
jgi:hypothetical protein